jgi:hypothetical protein
VIEIVLGSAPQFALPTTIPAANDVWGRMGRNSDGTWNGYRHPGASRKHGRLTLSRFNNFAETVMAESI